MEPDNLANFNGSRLVNLALTMGGRVLSVQAVFNVPECSAPLTDGRGVDPQNTPLTYSAVSATSRDPIPT